MYVIGLRDGRGTLRIVGDIKGNVLKGCNVDCEEWVVRRKGLRRDSVRARFSFGIS